MNTFLQRREGEQGLSFLKYAKSRELNISKLIDVFKELNDLESQSKSVTLNSEQLGNLTFLYMLVAKNLWQYEENGGLTDLRRELLY